MLQATVDSLIDMMYQSSNYIVNNFDDPELATSSRLKQTYARKVYFIRDVLQRKKQEISKDPREK